jgi:acyl-CoA synthetase (NDP forming)
LRPKSIAILGGGWAVNVIAQLQKSGFEGDIWPIHPKRDEILGIACLKSIDDLPAAPDATFIGVNREATIEVVAKLRKMGAGGATCFASGFLESEAENAGGADLQARLVDAAGDMPIIGPNCYGILNYLDNVTLWPDQHGGQRVARGVAIIAQSSNIAINMTMQRRGLPIAFVVAAGNQAQTGVSEIGEALLVDERVSAIGLYLEGFGDIRALERFAASARKANKPVVALKIGRSQKAQLATMTHTASLAGNAAVSSALLKRLGIIEVNSIAVFLETLKLLDRLGRLSGNAMCSVSCSGGEASLIADLAESRALEFRDFSKAQAKALKDELGPIVTVANPLDYHTFIWGDTERMTRVFCAVMGDQFDLVVFILDIPRSDRCDPSGYDCAVKAILAAKAKTRANVAVLASMPENLSEEVTARFAAGGVVAIHGMEEGLAAIEAIALPLPKASEIGEVLLNRNVSTIHTTLDERQSKAELAEFGLVIPGSVTSGNVAELATLAGALKYPVALKGLGLAHKSEAGAVVLNLSSSDELIEAAKGMTGIIGYLAEEMAQKCIAELLVGVTRDATGLFLLTIGAGGVNTEILKDTSSLLLPARREDIDDALARLKIAPLLRGYRGKPGANIEAVIDAVMAIGAYVEANADIVLELDVNPLIARQGDAIAVDALIRVQEKEKANE